MVSTPERFTDNIPMSPGPSVTVKNPSARTPLRLFTELLYVKKNFFPPGRCYQIKAQGNQSRQYIVVGYSKEESKYKKQLMGLEISL